VLAELVQKESILAARPTFLAGAAEERLSMRVKRFVLAAALANPQNKESTTGKHSNKILKNILAFSLKTKHFKLLYSYAI